MARRSTSGLHLRRRETQMRPGGPRSGRVSALAWSGLASAATLISVTGPVSNTSPTSTGSAAWAQAFTLAQNHTGVAIGAPTVCQGCTGFVFLTNDVGAAASLANVFNSDNYTGQSTLFSGLTLGPGDYFLVISITAGRLRLAGVGRTCIFRIEWCQCAALAARHHGRVAWIQVHLCGVPAGLPVHGNGRCSAGTGHLALNRQYPGRDRPSGSPSSSVKAQELHSKTKHYRRIPWIAASWVNRRVGCFAAGGNSDLRLRCRFPEAE